MFREYRAWIIYVCKSCGRVAARLAIKAAACPQRPVPAHSMNTSKAGSPVGQRQMACFVGREEGGKKKETEQLITLRHKRSRPSATPPASPLGRAVDIAASEQNSLAPGTSTEAIRIRLGVIELGQAGAPGSILRGSHSSLWTYSSAVWSTPPCAVFRGAKRSEMGSPPTSDWVSRPRQNRS